ncbi:MAG: tetratricopeptide repeat protein [Magnetococcales bacterium]|nr:tetratricopeptide repeat protein [Magnetococcales bacterium]MBF0154984.1 tetratricopeptide repeat protein [Magnetococcales bacterium]
MIRWSYALPLLLACTLFGWSSSMPLAMAGELDEIQSLVEKRQFPTAMGRLTNYLKSNPKDAQARFFKGLILAEEQKQSEAIQVFQELTEEFPDRPEPFNNLAVLYAEQGHLEKARDILLRAINSKPAYATARENLGDIYAKLASQSYRKALQINRENPVTEAKLALVRTLFVTSGSGPGATPGLPHSSEELLRKARNEALEKVRAENMDKLRAEALSQVRAEILEQVRTELRQKLHAEIVAQVRSTEMEKIRAEAVTLARNDEHERADAEVQERTRSEIEAKARAEKEKADLLAQQTREKKALPETKTDKSPPTLKKETKEDAKEKAKEKAIKDEAPTAMKQLAKGQIKTPDQAVRTANMTMIDQVFEAVEKESRDPKVTDQGDKQSTKDKDKDKDKDKSQDKKKSKDNEPDHNQTAGNQVQQTQLVEKAVRGWAEAWSGKQVPRYLAAYTRDFRLPAGFSRRDDWKNKRKYLIENAQSIQVGLDDIQIHMENQGLARVSFIQSYRSDKYQDVVRKSILMKKEGNEWKIFQEGVDG